MKTILLVLVLIFIAQILSCNKNTITEPEKNTNDKVRKEFYYNYITDKIPLRTCEYIYDNEMKLEKKYHYSGNDTTSPYQYEAFMYAEDNKIINKNTFHYVNETTGWILHDSTFYNYKNGNLSIKEVFVLTSSADHILYKYEYENSNLAKEFQYYNEQFNYYTEYHYSNNVCKYEVTFSNSSGTDTIKYINHYYQNGVLQKSEKFKSNNNKIQIITYKYDEANNLTIEEAIQTDPTVVKQLNYVIRYMY